jgi:hypothetical protein
MARTLSLRLALVAVLGLALVACGDDDTDGASPATTDAGQQAAGGDDPDGGTGDGEVPADGGGPATLASDSLHDLDMPDPDSAWVTLDGETYEFDGLSQCAVNEVDELISFDAAGSTELDDGRLIMFQVYRWITPPDAMDMFGAIHEIDFLQLSVEGEAGEGLFANSVHTTQRNEIGGPVTGDADSLPVLQVAEDGSAAAAVAEVRDPLAGLDAGDVPEAAEGTAEFAITC